MSFNFEQDYLADLESVLVELRKQGKHEVIARIDECKAVGSTGGEILSRLNGNLRNVLSDGPSQALEEVIREYLRKAPGY